MAERRRGRDEGLDYFEAKGPEFMQRVSTGCEVMAAKLGATVIDAEQSITEVHDQIWQTVQSWSPPPQQLNFAT